MLQPFGALLYLLMPAGTNKNRVAKGGIAA
jgi:hypothetical protein